MKLVGRFEFFSQHLALRGPKPAHHARPFLRPGCAKVYFYDVGKLAKRNARIVGGEVIEGDEIASRFQPLAGGDDAVFGLNRFQNLGHGLAGRQQRNQVFEQDLTGAIHEGALVIAKRLDTIKQGAIQGGAGGEFGIGVEIVFDIVAEKNLYPNTFCARSKMGWRATKRCPGSASESAAETFSLAGTGFTPLISA